MSDVDPAEPTASSPRRNSLNQTLKNLDRRHSAAGFGFAALCRSKRSAERLSLNPANCSLDGEHSVPGTCGTSGWGYVVPGYWSSRIPLGAFAYPGYSDTGYRRIPLGRQRRGIGVADAVPALMVSAALQPSPINGTLKVIFRRAQCQPSGFGDALVPRLCAGTVTIHEPTYGP